MVKPRLSILRRNLSGLLGLISSEWGFLTCIVSVSKPEFDGRAAGDTSLTNGSVDDDSVWKRLSCADEGIASQLIAACARGNNIGNKGQGRLVLIFSEDSCPPLESHA